MLTHRTSNQAYLIDFFSKGNSAVLLGLFAILAFGFIFERTYEYQKDIAALEELLLAERKGFIEEKVHAAKSFIEFSRTNSQLSLVATQSYVKEYLNSISFANDDGYLFVMNFQGDELVNGGQPQLVGRKAADVQDEIESKLTAKLLQIARQDGGGFARYLWLKPSTGYVVDKISYVASDNEWQWVIGTGMYLDDLGATVQVKKDELNVHLLIETLIVIACGCIAFFWFLFLNRHHRKVMIAEFANLSLGISQKDSNNAVLDSDRYQIKEFAAVARSVRETYAELTIAQDEVLAALSQARKADRAKGEFLANVSHELRTPLNSMLGATTFIQETSLDEEQGEYLDLIASGGKNLLALVNDILDLSKIEAGQFILEEVEFDLLLFIEEVCKDFGHQVEQKGIKLSFLIDPSFSVYLKADVGRIRQVVNNLLSNAIKFTKAGYVLVEIYGMSDSRNSTYLCVSVTDTGCGISENDQGRLFQRFSQIDNSLTRNHGGSGLGLVITKHLAELMEGDVSIESVLGVGSSFTAKMKVVTTSAAHFDNLSDSISDHEESILVLSPIIGRGIPLNAKFLSAGHFQITCDFICQPLPDECFDAVIIDEPDISTLGDYMEMLRANPNYQTTPVFVASYASQPPLSDNTITWLSKPLSRSSLYNAVRVRVLQEAPLLEMTTSPPIQPSCAEHFYEVLLVEDNLSNQIIAKKLLQKCGANVEIAHDGLQAVEKVSAKEYDIIFMDIQMPKMNGYEATIEIRKFEWENQRPHPPIVALTAHAFADDRIRCIDAGMSDYISKPVSIEAFRSILGKYHIGDYS